MLCSRKLSGPIIIISIFRPALSIQYTVAKEETIAFFLRLILAPTVGYGKRFMADDIVKRLKKNATSTIVRRCYERKWFPNLAGPGSGAEEPE
jgi:hypothetical protein